MPAWWRWKPKSKSKSTSSIPRKEEEEEEEEAAATPKRGEGSHKEKNISFDEALIARKGRDASPVFGGPGFVVGHRLPLPSSISSPLPSVTNSASASASASASGSSVSSSGSSEETSDRGVYRYPNSMNMPSGRNVAPDPPRHHDHASDGGRMFLRSPVREHPRCPDISVSPRKELHLHGFDPSTSGSTYSHSQISTDTIFSSRTNSSPPSSRGLPSPTSPVHSRTFILSPSSPIQKQENMRSLPHPLPLPPSSPSNSSRSQQSQWRKGKLLGRGTFGHVYLGFNSETGQMCAIKEVKVISDDSSSRESLKQLNQEITLLSQLSHPNIVQYYGSELADDTLSVYLEYVSGGSIHKLIQEYGAFKEPVIRNYAGQILSGLAYLHGRSTVHRDIKGANILVGTNGEVKLADFGMAKHISAYNSIRSFKGSPYWMAPEVIMNGNGYNLSVDIWSLGCTILEMATSKPPWSQYEGVAAIFKIGNSKDLPEIPDHLSAEGKSFVMLCLQRDPSARPTAVQLMDHPFVREQSTIRAAKFNLTEVYPSSLDGSHIMAIREFSSNRSISPLRDRDIGMRNIAAFPYSFPSSQMNSSMRMNMSLPVSPCSSPLRQFTQSNRSCLPSPPHPAYSAGAINYNPNNHALNPMRPSNTLIDPWPEIAQVKTQSPYGSPRRL